MSVFKDFPGLENLKKNSRTFKDPQQPCELTFPVTCQDAIIVNSIENRNHAIMNFLATADLLVATANQLSEKIQQYSV